MPVWSAPRVFSPVSTLRSIYRPLTSARVQSANSSPISRSAISASSALRALTRLSGKLGFPLYFAAAAACEHLRRPGSSRPPSRFQRLFSPSPQERQPASLMIENPVRSGQSVVFIEGDVTVLGSVGSGAEIVAGGSIHVYGALRGRALAGATGNARARIFCQRVEAELLAIDSYYRTADDIEDSLRCRPAQAWLEDGALQVSAMN